MRTTERFEKAVRLLYTAYHNNELQRGDCSYCVAGTLCNGNKAWYYFNMVEELGVCNAWSKSEAISSISPTGYSSEEILKIEALFLNETASTENKETQFKGLCAVVEYLCELDNIPNPMDYSKLFETDNDKPKYELSL